MVNPNNITVQIDSKIDKAKIQKLLGLLIITDESCKFYFTETNLGKGITSSENEYTDHARNYLIKYYDNMIDLKDLLEMANCTIVDRKDGCDIDLSPEKLEKDTIINLIK
jgi:hypothetical protein